MSGSRQAMRRWSLAASMGIMILSPGLAWADATPLNKDKTGIAWALPFKDALAKAEKANRLLLIKAVAFGTDSDGGW